MEEFLTSGQIREQYEKGRRNFNGVKSSTQDFGGFILKGSSFRNVDLSWSNFDNSDLSDCDFTEANITWSGIRHANLKNAVFTKANVSYCDFSGSTFENTDFRNADLTASLLFSVNVQGARTEGANMNLVATNIMQLSEEGLKAVLENLQRLGRQIPADLLAHVQLVVKQIHEKKNQLDGIKAKMAYQSQSSGKSDYSTSMTELQNSIDVLYGKLESLYTKAFTYGAKDSKEVYK